MKNFFYYTNLILCIGTTAAWLITPMLGAMAHFILGVFQAVNAVIYLVQLRSFGLRAKKMYRIYGLFVLLLIALGILSATQTFDSPELKQTLAFLLMLGSGVAAILFTYVAYLVKNEVSEKFAVTTDSEILDSDMIL